MKITIDKYFLFSIILNVGLTVAMVYTYFGGSTHDEAMKKIESNKEVIAKEKAVIGREEKEIKTIAVETYHLKEQSGCVLEWEDK